MTPYKKAFAVFFAVVLAFTLPMVIAFSIDKTYCINNPAANHCGYWNED